MRISRLTILSLLLILLGVGLVADFPTRLPITPQTQNLLFMGGKGIQFRGTTTANYIGLIGPAAPAASVTFTLPAADGTAGQFLTTDGSAVLSWSAGGATAHILLSATHSDTTASAVVRGDLITGQGAPAKWTALTVGGAGTVLSSDGTDAGWTATPTLGNVAANGALNLYGLHANGYYSIIKGSNAEGLVGADLRIGLDETNRTLIICDRGDIDADFGLTAASNPLLIIKSADKATQTTISSANVTTNRVTGNPLRLDSTGTSLIVETYANIPMKFVPRTNINPGHAIYLDGTHYAESPALTDTDGQQAFCYINGIANQSGTAAFDLIYGNATLTGVGTGATGDGNNLFRLAVAGTTAYRVDQWGHEHGGESASLADTAVLTTNIANTWNGFAYVTCSDNVVAAYRLEAGSLSVVSANAAFGVVQGVDTLWNVYFASNVLKVENQRGSTLTAKVQFRGY